MFLNKLDRYILRKFLGTYFYAIALLTVLVVIFDLSERLDDFLANQAPVEGIIFDYYLNFVPYIINLFSGLFTFIAVIFFTSKMTAHSEIIAILSSGVSYRRFLRPYFVGGILIALLSFYLINWVIPHATARRLEFEEKYYRESAYQNRERNIHRQIQPGVYIYMQSYNTALNIGYKFTLERFENQRLKEKIVSDYIKWDTTKKCWTIYNYYQRQYDSISESLTTGASKDTLLPNFDYRDYSSRIQMIETLNFGELMNYIEKQRLSGTSNIAVYKIEKHKRLALPFASIILSIMGVCISSEKRRGGMGLNLGLGLALAFSYIMMLQVTQVFAINAGFNPLLSLWIPNVIYMIITFLLYKRASR
ncbi:MAG TPA: LptF/LptG family permease [Salinivirgaceae bacterium]|nr:LptF/LptG family permease [Salinivirgaceae bacterium]